MTILISYETLFGEKRKKEIDNVVDYDLNCTILGDHTIVIYFANDIRDYEFHRILEVKEN
jgi:hypothetical protein